MTEPPNKEFSAKPMPPSLLKSPGRRRRSSVSSAHANPPVPPPRANSRVASMVIQQSEDRAREGDKDSDFLLLRPKFNPEQDLSKRNRRQRVDSISVASRDDDTASRRSRADGSKKVLFEDSLTRRDKANASFVSTSSFGRASSSGGILKNKRQPEATKSSFAPPKEKPARQFPVSSKFECGDDFSPKRNDQIDSSLERRREHRREAGERARLAAAKKQETRQNLGLFPSSQFRTENDHNDDRRDKLQTKKAAPPIEDKQTQESEDEGFFDKVAGWFKDAFSVCGSAQPHKNSQDKEHARQEEALEAKERNSQQVPNTVKLEPFEEVKAGTDDEPSNSQLTEPPPRQTDPNSLKRAKKTMSGVKKPPSARQKGSKLRSQIVERPASRRELE